MSEFPLRAARQPGSGSGPVADPAERSGRGASGGPDRHGPGDGGHGGRRPPERRRGRRFRGRAARLRWRPWLLLAPALGVLAALLLYPLGRVVWLSFQDYGLRQIVSGESNPVGFANYTNLLSDPYLWKVVLPNTVGFAIVNVVLTVVVGTLVALLLASLGPRWRAVVTTAVLVAWAVPAITGTYVWAFLFDPVDGVATRLLAWLGLIDPTTFNPFTERWTFYAVVTLNVVHHSFPFVAITVLAGLLTVPRELIEAATIDGAGAVRRFFSVIVPVLKPVFAVVTILSTIWDFKVFTQVYLMPGGDGGNRSLLNLGVWSYVESFGQNKFGLGAAIAVLLTLVLLGITAMYLRLLFSEEEL